MRDRRGRAGRPKRIGEALDRALDPIVPKTPLAKIQRVWPAAVGPQIANVTKVLQEFDGTVTIECESTIWANELEMMSTQLLDKLASEMGGAVPERLRFLTAG